MVPVDPVPPVVDVAVTRSLGCLFVVAIIVGAIAIVRGAAVCHAILPRLSLLRLTCSITTTQHDTPCPCQRRHDRCPSQRNSNNRPEAPASAHARNPRARSHRFLRVELLDRLPANLSACRCDRPGHRILSTISISLSQRENIRGGISKRTRTERSDRTLLAYIP